MALFVNLFFAVIITGISIFLAYEFYMQRKEEKTRKHLIKTDENSINSYLNIS